MKRRLIEKAVFFDIAKPTRALILLPLILLPSDKEVIGLRVADIRDGKEKVLASVSLSPSVALDVCSFLVSSASFIQSKGFPGCEGTKLIIGTDYMVGAMNPLHSARFRIELPGGVAEEVVLGKDDLRKLRQLLRDAVKRGFKDDEVAAGNSDVLDPAADLALCRKATEEPWRVKKIPFNDIHLSQVVAGDRVLIPAGILCHSDADFVVAARNKWFAYILRVEELETAIQAHREAIVSEMEAHTDGHTDEDRRIAHCEVIRTRKELFALIRPADESD